MINIRPVSDLRNKFPEVEADLIQSGEPIFLTKNGYGSMVIMSIEQYTKLTDDIELKLDEADKAADASDVRYTENEAFAKVRKNSMGEKKYKLRFLPLFVDDLTEITDYIANTLNNPHAANKLIDEVEKAINERLPFAESFEPFPLKNERKFPYYRISVRNFTVYYVVIDDVMEVRRILYSRRNISKLI